MLQMKFDLDRTAGLRDIYVWKCERTDGRMPARVPYYKLTKSLRLRWTINNEPHLKWCVHQEKTQISFGIHQMGPQSLLPMWKSLSPRVSNESKAMVLIIYCQTNALADLSHKLMGIWQYLLCSVHFLWSICFYVITLLKHIFRIIWSNT